MGAGRVKTDRVLKALRRQEPDRVPLGEFFWSAFVQRARAEIAGGGAFDPYRHWHTSGGAGSHIG